MSHAALTAAVRARVLQAFADLQLGSGEHLHETILIKGGNYCGRRFATDGGHAIWFAEEDQLKMCGADGRVLCVIESASRRPNHHRAAA